MKTCCYEVKLQIKNCKECSVETYILTTEVCCDDPTEQSCDQNLKKEIMKYWVINPELSKNVLSEYNFFDNITKIECEENSELGIKKVSSTPIDPGKFL